jgi:hypothetical protein
MKGLVNFIEVFELCHLNLVSKKRDSIVNMNGTHETEQSKLKSSMKKG